MSLLLDALAYAHILSAVAWLGGGILTGFVVGPNLMKLSPQARLEFNAKVLPRVLRFVQAAIGATFLFGLVFFYELFNGSFSTLSATSQGKDIYAGIVLGVLAAIVAWSVTFPSFNKVVKLSEEALKSTPPSPSSEMAKYGGRARMGALVGMVLLLLALAMMVAAGAAGF